MTAVKKLTAKELIAKGYRRISIKGRLVSRIDRPDWRQYMAAQHSPWDPKGEGMRWACSPGMEDHYRRCYSKDTLTVAANIISLIPTSCGSSVGYIDNSLCPYCGGQHCDCGTDISL